MNWGMNMGKQHILIWKTGTSIQGFVGRISDRCGSKFQSSQIGIRWQRWTNMAPIEFDI